MKNKKAFMVLTTLVTIVITAILLIGAINAATKYSKGISNKHKLDSLVQLTKKIVDFNFSKNTEKDFYGSNQRFVLGSNELFLFFSAGNQPIRLRHDPEFKGPLIQTSIVDSDHWLEFERPKNEACQDTACICYCAAPRNFLTKIDSEPYLRSTQLLLSNTSTSKPFHCDKISCKAVGKKGDDALLFGNSRGVDEEYVEDVIKTVQNYNSGKKKTFYPIPMDMVILTQNRASDDGNLFFSDVCDPVGSPIDTVDCYNFASQDKGYLKMLLEEYYWQGGVVIGGMGFAKDSKDMDNHILRDVPITLRLEKIKGHENVIGVCTNDKCLYEKELNKLSSYQENQEKLAEFEQKAKEQFIHFDLFMRQKMAPGLSSLKGDYLTLKQQKSEYDLLNNFSKELKDVFDAMPKTDGITSSISFIKDPTNEKLTKIDLIINGVVFYEGDSLSLYFPYDDQEKQYKSNIVISSFDGTTLTLKDTSFFKSSIKKINIITTSTDKSSALQFK